MLSLILEQAKCFPTTWKENNSPVNEKMNMSQFIYIQMFRWNDGSQVHRHFDFRQTSEKLDQQGWRAQLVTEGEKKNMLKDCKICTLLQSWQLNLCIFQRVDLDLKVFDYFQFYEKKSPFKLPLNK